MAAVSVSHKADGSTLPLAGNIKMLGHDVPLIIDILPKDVIIELISVLLEHPSVLGIALVFNPAVPKYTSRPGFNIVRDGKLWKRLETGIYNSSQDVIYYITNVYARSSIDFLSVGSNSQAVIGIINHLRSAVNYTAVAESVEVLDSKEQPTGIMRKDERYIIDTPKRISFYKGGKQYGEEVYFATNGQIIWRRFWLSDGKTSFLDGIEEKYFFLVPPKVIDVKTDTGNKQVVIPIPAVTKYWIAGKEVTKEAFDGRKETVTQETPLVPDLANIVSKYL